MFFGKVVNISHLFLYLFFFWDVTEISTLLAPNVSDDEEGSNNGSSSPTAEDHPGAQIAVAAAAIDSGLIVNHKKRSFQEDAAATLGPNKRQVTITSMDCYQHNHPSNNKPVARITLSSACGQLLDLDHTNHSEPTLPATSVVVSPSPVISAGTTATAGLPARVVSSSSSSAVPSKTSSSKAKSSKSKKTKTSTNSTTTTSTTKKKTSEMTPAEKAKMCRDRNREHARKTRLRKKAYVEELKRNLNELVEARDAKLAQEEHASKLEQQNRDVRFQVMEDFMHLRGNNELNPERWSAILDDDFVFTLPSSMNNFQTTVHPYEGQGQQQVLMGVPEVMADTSYFASFLQTLTTGSTVTMMYQCHRDTFLMDNVQAVLNFSATSSGVTSLSNELTLMGSMRASFNPTTNKLKSVTLMMDTGTLHAQLQQQSNH